MVSDPFTVWPVGHQTTVLPLNLVFQFLQFLREDTPNTGLRLSESRRSSYVTLNGLEQTIR